MTVRIVYSALCHNHHALALFSHAINGIFAGEPSDRSCQYHLQYRLISQEEAQEGSARDAKENGRNQQAFDPDYRGRVLQLMFTVDDPNVFTTPWSATVTYRRMTQDQWLENVCAENPHKYGTEEDAQVPTAKVPDF